MNESMTRGQLSLTSSQWSVVSQPLSRLAEVLHRCLGTYGHSTTDGR